MQSSLDTPRQKPAFLPALLTCLLAPVAFAVAQENPPAAAAPAAPSNPLTAHSKFLFQGLKSIVIRSAEKVPEENYAFKPTESVRSIGQIFGHVADAQYLFCSQVLGEKNPSPGIEKTKTTKADLIAALKDAFAYCDKAYDGLTDASAAQMVKHGASDMPKLGVMTIDLLHTTEHYGNLVTYMRMRNIVPPTSEPEFMKQMMKK